MTKRIPVAAALAAMWLTSSAAYASEVGDDLSQAGHAIGKAATDTGHAISDGAKKTGRAIKETSKDAALTTKVRAALTQEKGLSLFGIHISSDATAGVVTLTGTVQYAEQIEQAGNAAKAVEGVKDVKNELTQEKKK